MRRETHFKFSEQKAKIKTTKKVKPNEKIISIRNWNPIVEEETEEKKLRNQGKKQKLPETKPAA